jgi:UDP-N-acetylmuramoylalanine--D-glutamate ligase
LAIAATQGLATKEAVLQTILSFNGLNHRSELILSEDGINYIDSSADSSPERSARTLGEISGRAAAIVGGRGKGLSHGPLCDALLKKCIGAVAIGETADEIIEYMRRDKKYAGFNIVRAGGMHEAVRLARNMLGGEGTLILSPAATSFDTYKNFEERALDFKSACIALSKKEL